MRRSSSGKIIKRGFGTAATVLVCSVFAALRVSVTPAGAASAASDGGDNATPAAQSAAPASAGAAESAPASTAQNTSTAASEPTLDDIINRAVTAYGGRENLSAVENNWALFGKQTTSDSNETVDYRGSHKGSKWRIDLEAGAAEGATEAASTDKGAVVTAFDGSSSWQSLGNEISTLSPDKFLWLNEQQRRQPFLLSHYHDNDYKFELQGRTQYKQLPVFGVQVTKFGETPSILYIDQNNYLVTAITYEIETASGEAKTASKFPVAAEYGEYRPTSNIVWPFKQTQIVNGKQVSQIEVTSLNAASPLEDNLFSRPTNGTSYRIPRPVTIPFDYSQKEVVVKGRLNGSEEMDFLIDTGASETIIDRRVSAEHFLAKEGRYDIAAIAGLVTARSSTVKRLELGNLIMNDVQSRILDLSPQSRQMGRQIAGIIGTNIISKFVVTLDYSKPSITFSDLDSAPRPRTAAMVPFTQKQAPFVKVLFNGRDEHVLLVDTGAAFNHIPTVVASKYFGSDPSNVRHVTEGTGLDGRPLQLGTVVVDAVNIGGQPVRKVTFTFPFKQEAAKAQPSLGQREGGFFQDSRLGILGNPFWQNFIVTIDYKFQRLMLQPNPIVKLRADIDSSLIIGDNKLVLHRDYRASELAYQRALMLADSGNDTREQARLLGRLGNLRRVMAKDLQRPEHSKAAYEYFVKAREKAILAKAQDVQGRILADWSLLYSDNGQQVESKATIDRALLLAPQDANVNVDCAVHLFRARLFPETQKYIEKALFLEPNNWQALWYQVKLSESFYDTPRVVATLKEILRFYPWSMVAQNKLKQITSLQAGAVTDSSPDVPTANGSGTSAPNKSAGSATAPKPTSETSPLRPRSGIGMPKSRPN